MRNELSTKIFEQNLDKICYSEDFKHLIRYKDLQDISIKLNQFLSKVSNLNCRIGLFSQIDRVYAFYALSLMENGIYVPINPKLNETQLIEYLEMFNVDVILVEDTQTFNDEKLVHFPKWTFNHNDDFIGNIIHAKSESTYAILTTTSGTSDIPKRVPLYYESWVYSIPKYNEFFEFDENVKQYVYVHLHRVASLYIILRTWMAHGEVIYNQDKNLKNVIQSLRCEDLTHLNGPPALLNSLVQTLKIQKFPIKRKYKLQVHTSGASLNQTLYNDISYWLDANVYNNYGLTEVYYIASTYKTKHLSYQHNGQMIIDEYKLVNNELWAKGPQVFKGYDGSENGFEGDWFKTGDIVEFDENGYCKVIGRLKEFINRGGEKILPYHIEKLIEKHFPEIKQCIVFPIPNTYGSDDVACAIVSNIEIDLKSIRSKLLSELEAYKCPTKLFRLEQIPVSNEKINRNQFYEMHLKDIEELK